LRRNVPVVCATIVLTTSGIFSWLRVAPVYLEKELGAPPEKIGLAFMVLALCFRGFQIFGGWLSDRIGRKRMMVAGTLLMAPCYALTAHAESWTGFVAALAVCWGIGSMQWPSFVALAGESVEPSRRGRALGWMEFCGVLGMLAGPAVGALALQRVRLPVLIDATAVVYAVVGLARAAFLREPPGAAEDAAAPHPSVGLVVVGLMCGVLGTTCFFLTWDGPFPSLYLSHVYGLDYSGINWNMTLGGLTALVTSLAGGRLIDRFGSVRVLSFALLIWAALSALFFYKPWIDPRPHGGGYALLIAMLVPVELFTLSYQRLSASIGPGRRRAFFVGLFGTSAGLAAATSLWWGGLLYDAYGYDGPMAVALAAALGGLVLAALLRAGIEVRAAPRL
jgi:MFS family permease